MTASVDALGNRSTSVYDAAGNVVANQDGAGGVSWPGRVTVTFADALCAVRRWLWAAVVLPQAGNATALQELPEPGRELLLTTLAPAA